MKKTVAKNITQDEQLNSCLACRTNWKRMGEGGYTSNSYKKIFNFKEYFQIYLNSQ